MRYNDTINYIILEAVELGRIFHLPFALEISTSTLTFIKFGNKMKAPLYNEILDICQNIACASEKDDDVARNNACGELQKLCASNQNSPKDHPLQWEALADFTDDGDQAMDIYQIALATAEELKLDTFIASAYLAMAQRQQEFEDSAKALEYATLADGAAKNISSEELKQEIKEILSTLTNG